MWVDVYNLCIACIDAVADDTDLESIAHNVHCILCTIPHLYDIIKQRANCGAIDFMIIKSDLTFQQFLELVVTYDQPGNNDTVFYTNAIMTIWCRLHWIHDQTLMERKLSPIIYDGIDALQSTLTKGKFDKKNVVSKDKKNRQVKGYKTKLSTKIQKI